MEYHVSALLRRFKAPNRPALISRAYKLGILSAGVWPPRIRPEFVTDRPTKNEGPQPAAGTSRHFPS